MPLSIGERLGPYETLAPIGSGGMGEVYKARDTRLERLVAIKVLPADKVADAARKQRFMQEARAASALNHPNIVTVHDICDEGDIHFLVMEYVPGKTLEQMVPRKGLRLSDTLKYAVQIADALATAHSAGIVHRDVKPSNIMVTDRRPQASERPQPKLARLFCRTLGRRHPGGRNSRFEGQHMARPIRTALRVTERFQRRDFGHMDLEITMTDAKAYTKPWRIELPPHLLPDNELLEWICLEGNRGMEHMVGK
jgi:serine/threonine protein kinase